MRSGILSVLTVFVAVNVSQAEYGKLEDGRSWWSAAHKDGDHAKVVGAVNQYLASGASNRRVRARFDLADAYRVGEDYTNASAAYGGVLQDPLADDEDQFRAVVGMATVKRQGGQSTAEEAVTSIADARKQYAGTQSGLLASAATHQAYLLRHVIGDKARAAQVANSALKKYAHLPIMSRMTLYSEACYSDSQNKGTIAAAALQETEGMKHRIRFRFANAVPETMQAEIVEVLQTCWETNPAGAAELYKRLDYTLWPSEQAWINAHKQLRGMIRNTEDTQQLLQLIGNELAKYEF